MRALVSGDQGFVGRHLTFLLAQSGYDVAGFDVQSGQDVRDYEQVHATVEALQPDVVFHLAAQGYVAESVTDPLRAYAINVMGTVHVLEALRQTGCGARVVLAGTSEEYGYDHTSVITESTAPHPSTPYGATKLAATHAGLVWHERYGLPVMVTRAFNHTGPGQSPAYAVSAFARRVVRVEKGLDVQVTHGDLSSWRDFSDVRDVVRAYLTVAESGTPGEVYNVAAGQSVQMQDVMDFLAELSDHEITPRLDASLFRPSKEPHRFVAGARKIEALGWKREITLIDTLRDLLADWRGKT